MKPSATVVSLGREVPRGDATEWSIRMPVIEKVFGFLIAAIAVQLILDALSKLGVMPTLPHFHLTRMKPGSQVVSDDGPYGLSVNDGDVVMDRLFRVTEAVGV